MLVVAIIRLLQVEFKYLAEATFMKMNYVAALPYDFQ